MTIRSGLDVQPRPMALPSPGRKTASGGLKPVPRHRLRRFPSQPHAASGKNRPRYDRARRGSELPQKDEADIVVTGSCRGTCPDVKYILGDGRYTFNPNYVDPVPWLNLENYLSAEVTAALAATGVGALPSLAERMAVSRTFGVTSSRFGNNFYRGGAGQGSWNYGSTRLGWSFNARTGNVYFQPRIGNYHVPTPIFTPAPW